MTQSNAADRFIIDVGGRPVDVLVAGPADGLPLVFHSGTPVGLVAHQPTIDAAARSGLRLVMYSRPGYGNSGPLPGRSVADAAADVAAVLDRLGAPAFVTAGWSGGGPHALACAALLPGRCLAAATIAGVAPYPAEGIDWLEGMAAENVAEFSAALAGEAELTAMLDGEAADLAEVTADQVIAALGGLITDVDRAVLTGEFAAHVAESFKAAVSAGIAGWRDDDLAFVKYWGFSLDDMSAAVPVRIWQGDQDAMVPFGHGRWLASRISGARGHLLAGEGHLSIAVSKLAEIFAELAGLAQSAQSAPGN
jgi:pimeloyl-ACP methyl ester carboxylesterase